MQNGPKKDSSDLYSTMVAGVFILALVGVWSFPKMEFFRLVNPLHGPYLDGFFKAITYLGDGWCSITIGMLLILTGKRSIGIKVLVAYAISGALAQLLKKFIAMPRPRAIIPDSAYPHFLPGYTLDGWNAFPSGHTASVFALTAILAWSSPVQANRAMLAIAAILTGYSRIYLGQHFPDDVLSGALLGLFTAYVVFRFQDRLAGRNSRSIG
jgi:membrane-associated phospholipid phosphatase